MTESKMVAVGEIKVMGDESAALLIATPGTKANAAVVETVAPIAAEAVANDDTVVAATAVAVDKRVAEEDLVSGTDDRVPAMEVVTDDAGKVRLSFAFPDGSRSWLEVDDHGQPTDLARSDIASTTWNLIAQLMGVQIVSDPTWLYAIVTPTRDILWGIKRDGTIVDFKTPDQSRWPAVAPGDSTTYGADLASPTTTRWSTLLAADLGQAIENWGQSGATSAEIQWHWGSVNARATVTNGSIPASGAVVLTGFDIDFLRGSNITSAPVELLADDGARVAGTLTRTSSTVRTFTRAAAGAAVTAAAVDVRCTRFDTSRDRVLFIGQGINDEDAIVAGTMTLAQVQARYRDALSMLTVGRRRVIVWGVLDRGPVEAAGTARGDFIRALEAWLKVTLGTEFAALREYLASSRGLADAAIVQPGFAPTADDSAAVAVGTVPPSFRSSASSVHLNELGHKLQARLFARIIRSKGWTS